jgi:membrane-bound metal-dependent hydrolase YbcI (DUF457 family)
VFVGHTAVALAAKRQAPHVSLGVLLAAAYALDLLWPLFLIAGIEHVRIDPGNTAFTPLALDSYPWSHSLLMVTVWGLAGALLARTLGVDRRGQIVIFVLVLSHWVLDAITHRPDMPLWPGQSPMVGLGLWNSIAATLVIEGLLFAAGVVLYLRATPMRTRASTLGFLALVVLQLAIWAAQPWGPPPPDTRTLAWAGLALWLFPVWGWFIDKRARPGRIT